jgi:hypothetical protein
MLELLERQKDLTADQQKIATAGAGDLSPEDMHQGQWPSSRDRTTPRDGGDGRVAFSLRPGQWPRVFPGL